MNFTVGVTPCFVWGRGLRAFLFQIKVEDLFLEIKVLMVLIFNHRHQ